MNMEELNTTSDFQAQSNGYEAQQDTTATPDWRSNLPPEMQQAAARFNSPEALLKAYIGAESLIGKKVSDFAQQDYQTYASIMQQVTGIPADASGYNIEMSQHESCALTEDDIADVKEISSRLGLNNDQAQALADTMNAYGNACMEDQINQCNQSFQELANMWGNAADTKLAAIDRCVNSVLPQLMGVPSSTVKELLQGSWTSPAIMNALANLGELSMDSGSTGYNNLSPTDASIRLEQMKSDPNVTQILMNPTHPRHAELKQEFRTLLSLKR